MREERVRLEEQLAAAEGTRKVLEAQIQQLQVIVLLRFIYCTVYLISKTLYARLNGTS